ncbi:rho GTPase-activating protein 31 [Betta splendens]|uniref:Rho GTPase-activating protein 31 n=1 Tax=Betta splendens TaxID=158456 RepID=A0A6P7PCQ2_BETSP|nr:rho GTPase-activating protein 31 [Betta splendens]XP_029029961.1 rho GTPase-activating protein 31 [Betta splendens]
MKNKGTKQKSKKKGSENAFGCDLIEHLQNSGQDVPQVLKKCAEFIEKHGIVDGIYRLSGVTSNIQRLRQEFCSEACPDLTKEVYLQDIHCVGSLCKLYFRELPNPLLTYELYRKFTETVSVQGDHERLVYIQKVVKQLPTPHFRTLEFLTKHLAHLATLSTQTNMHTRNLALVWAPNLLRSKDVESSSANGDMAFQEVRIQQSVIEFILNHTEQIFSSDSVQIKPKEGLSLMCGEKYATLPMGGQCGPMKLMSLEEAQARSLSPNHPVHRERQRENSLPDANTASLFHTVIDVTDSKRRVSGKSKRWKSIFNLGRSVDSKGKLSRNGSVFIRAQGGTEKAALRPSRSMESLCSLPTDDDRTGHSPAGGTVSVFVPEVKSRTLGSDSLYDLSEHDQSWDVKEAKSGGATGGWSPGGNQKASPGAPAAPQKSLPEQLKVFKGDDVGGYKPTSPKNRRMLYAGSSRPSFPGSFFPLESSPRHQRRAVNISEPFAVSVPLRVSAVISSNSTPCRGHATLKACKETSELGSSSGKSNTFPQMEPGKQEAMERKNTEELTSRDPPGDLRKELVPEGQGEKRIFKLELSSLANVMGGKDAAPPAGKQPTAPHLDKGSSSEQQLWSELKITETDLLDEALEPAVSSGSGCRGARLTVDVKSKRSRSSPSLSLLCRDPSSSASPGDGGSAAGSNCARKQPSEPDIVSRLHGDAAATARPVDAAIGKPERLQRSATASDLHEAGDSPQEVGPDEAAIPSTADDDQAAGNETDKSQNHELTQGKSIGEAAKSLIPDGGAALRLSLSFDDRRNTLELPNPDDDEGCGGNSEELDLVEPWEDVSSAKQWVTSPLHSPDVEELLNQLSPFGTRLETARPQEGTTPPPRVVGNSGPRTPAGQAEPTWTPWPPAPSRVGASGGAGRSSAAKQKSAAPAPAHRFHRQTSHEPAASEKREERGLSKSRPCSLNLEQGFRCIRDISNQQNHKSSERGPQNPAGAANNGPPSELELFLSDRQAPLRRNSAPVSVASVRTAFMIKTCQAKAVPVVPPKVQYSQIPHSRQDAAKEQDREQPRASADGMSDLREELENKEPAEKSAESEKGASGPEGPVIKRRHAPSLEVFVDCPRPNRGSVLQRPSFRNRQRPQSLILLSPPFPIMDYPPPGDDGRLLSPVRREMAENFRTPDGISVQSKMTIPKSGQRLETSTSCFYQPQRRSMIFDSRSHRQIE